MVAVSVVGVPPKEGREVASHVHDEEDEQEQRGAVENIRQTWPKSRKTSAKFP